MKRIGRFLLVALFAAFATGCAAPEVTLKSALLNKLSTKSLEIGLNLEVFNPNDFSIPIQEIGYELDLFGARFTSGVTQFSRNVGAKERSTVEVPLGISFQSVSVGVQNVLTSQTIPWAIRGNCQFRTPRGPLKAGFSDQGSWKNPLLNR